MTRILFYGWIFGMNGVAFTKLLADRANLGLLQSWNICLQILNDETVELEVKAIEVAEEIVLRSIELGVKAKIEI